MYKYYIQRIKKDQVAVHKQHTHSIYIRGIHGVMATVLGKGHEDKSSNSGRGCLHFTGKGMSSTILSPARGKE